MRSKAFILIFFTFLLVLSCNKNQNIKFETLSFTEKNFDCTTECPEMNIDKVFAKSSSPIANKINQLIDQRFIYLLTLDEDKASHTENFEAAAGTFIQSYQNDKASFPDMAAKYDATIESEVLHHSKNLLSLHIFSHIYTGGAHGFSATTYINIDPRTGKEIEVEQLINNKEKFIALVEKKFRDTYNIPSGEDINSTKFLFENNSFELPSQIGFDNRNMLLTYNPYDIAPYSEGLIHLKLPIEEIQNFINIDLK